ncbi:ATP-dependent Clp protease adaptor ClpS [Haoranjiania flava]|uniref:ATP-dependent Clp protease adaptor ClpS n=1 Tax=Haoranjiania flava TaxID=1856322 RepID=A0AAE3ISD2_9BACT|nr:ATP-dependent Clp protease adaptor ClpS [Haoranjiania flava]MCU7695521.1 ATP-dependent Clp protease adaptor ClpS [Haoranjiania flava]
MNNYNGDKPLHWEEEHSDVLTDKADKFQLIVWNDDVNTFDWVIQTLIEVCRHEPEQAEQCTLLIHFKGKCVVKTGEYDTLKSMKNEIIERGINATIEAHDD